MHRHLVIALVATAVVLGSSRASAFCRTTTNQDFEPTTAKPCDDVGKPLSWASKCVGFSVQKDASVQADLATATRIADASFAEWSAHDCGACGTAGKPTIAGQDLGPVSCGTVEFNPSGGNANVIVFRDGEWPHSGTALALTTVTFNTATGEIYDADMEIQSNPKDLKLSVSDPVPADGFDLRSIITHETGHVFGLAHTQRTHTEATMFETYTPGETLKRDLAEDDICGICTAYPPTRSANCDPTPRGGLADQCGGGGAPETKCSCSVPGGPHQTELVVVAGLAAAVGGVRRARRRR